MKKFYAGWLGRGTPTISEIEVEETSTYLLRIVGVHKTYWGYAPVVNNHLMKSEASNIFDSLKEAIFHMAHQLMTDKEKIIKQAEDVEQSIREVQNLLLENQ